MNIQTLVTKLKKFLAPPDNAPRWRKILPYAVLGVLTLIVVVSATYGWNYTNSPSFCAEGCHTMPPQGASYYESPHANVYCTECHIGRAFVRSFPAKHRMCARSLPWRLHLMSSPSVHHIYSLHAKPVSSAICLKNSQTTVCARSHALQITSKTPRPPRIWS